MVMTTSNRSGQLCPQCEREPQLRERVHPQPLLTTIPALLSMSKQVMNDSVGLVLDPWSWRARLVGIPPTMPKSEDSASQPEAAQKVYPSDLAAAKVSKRGKNTVHFLEPEHKKQFHFGTAEVPIIPAERINFELYEVISPVDDPPRVINVDYDTKTNRWCVDESAAFADREDRIALICSKSVLRAIKYDRSFVRDLTCASSASKSPFQVNRLPDYDMTKVLNGDLVKLKAASHDLFHVNNLEEFLLHTHRDRQHDISASGGQYMKHWLIDLRQLITALSNPDHRLHLRSAFWGLVRRGFAEKVTLQLWSGSGPEPDQAADIEILDWITWITKYKGKISENLRQDLGQALGFFHSGTFFAPPWPPVPHLDFSIMSHKGITSGSAAEMIAAESTEPSSINSSSTSALVSPMPHTELGKGDLNGTSTSVKPHSAQYADGKLQPWPYSAMDATQPLRTKHHIHASGPEPHPHAPETLLPDTVVTHTVANGPAKRASCPYPRPFVLAHAGPGDLLSPELPVKETHKLLGIGSLYSTTSIPPSRPFSPTILSDDSVAGSDLTDKNVLTEFGAFVADGQAPAKVDYGRETGGLVELGETLSDTSLKANSKDDRAAARVERAMGGPKECTSAFEGEPVHLEDSDRANSRKCATEIREHLMKSWISELSLHDRTKNNTAPPEFDAVGAGMDYSEFSCQLDAALDAEQVSFRSVSGSQDDLSQSYEDWAKELDISHNESHLRQAMEEELAEEWARADSMYHHLWGLGPKTMDTVQNNLPRFELDGRFAEIMSLSDKRLGQPFQNDRLSDDNGNTVKADVGMCKQQLEEANEAVMRLERMLDVAKKEAKEGRDGQDQKTRELEEMKKDRAQLKASLRFDANGDHGPTDVSGTMQVPQNSLEDNSQRDGKGEPRSMPIQGAQTEMGDIAEQPLRTSSTSDDGNAIPRLSTSQQLNGGINGVQAEPRSTSLTSTSTCQSLSLADACSCDDSNSFSMTPNDLDHAEFSAGVPCSDSNEASKEANGNVGQLLNQTSICSDSGDDRASSQVDSDVSAETIKLADTNGTPLINGHLDIDGTNHCIAVNETLTTGHTDRNGVAVACPEQLPNTIRTAVSGRRSNDFLATVPREFLDYEALDAGPEEISDGIAAAEPDHLTNNVHRGPSSPGKKKGALRKKRAPLKKGK